MPIDNDSTPSLEITIDSPGDGTTLTSPSQALPISGTVDGYLVKTPTVTVEVGGASYPATVTTQSSSGNITGTWTSQGPALNLGSLKILAKATAQKTSDGKNLMTTATATIKIEDKKPPSPSILAPKSGEQVPVSETSAVVPLRLQVTDEWGVKTVEWWLDGTAKSGKAQQSSTNPEEWSAYVDMPDYSWGTYKIVVRATDLGMNTQEASHSFVVVDKTAPHFQVFEPQENQRIVASSLPCKVRLVGTSWDRQSGMAGGQARVEWALDGQLPFSPFADWVNWETEVSIPDYGDHIIHLRLTDASGNSITKLIHLQLVSSYQPSSLEELLSPRAYLEALLAFAAHHVTLPGEGPLSSSRLEKIFYHPFSNLTCDPLRCSRLPDNSCVTVS